MRYICEMMQRGMLLRPPEPFSFEECCWFLDRNLGDCLHEIRPGALRKALPAAEGPLLADIFWEAPHIRVNLLQVPWTADREAFVRHYLTEWFDLEKDLDGFYTRLEACKPLRYMGEAYRGLRLMGIPDLFEALAWCIIGQQINLSFALTVKERLVGRYGEKVIYQGKPYFTFPAPGRILDADPDVLRAMQLSRRKIEYLKGLAALFAAGTISREILQALPDFGARQQLLTSIRGVGVWTANYALMKSLKDSCVPHGDAGLANALLQHGIIRDKKDTEAMARFFEGFPGWESYLVFYLWRSLSGPARTLCGAGKTL